MLKSLLVSGWFRVQPFIKYIAIIIVISPLVGMSLHATVAKQTEVKKISSRNAKSEAKSVEKGIFGQINSQFAEVNSRTGKISIGEGIQTLPTDKVIADAKVDHAPVVNNVVRKTTTLVVNVAQNPGETSVNQINVIQKLRDAKDTELNSGQNAVSESKDLATSTVRPKNPEIPVSEQPNESEMVQADPIGSPHPIPWQWIMTTQEKVGGKGGGVRYYRSIPVVSPDGKYAIYSRVHMEVKPEMHNSRVNSVLFVEDRQTKRLRVMASTNVMGDPLLNKQASVSEDTDNDGKIGVLVPVSWSEKGDRFLARRFVAIFNTADATDQAVIWDRQQNNINVVHPAESKDDHEKIAILLGWSKKQPKNVLFRSGELGQEDWPLIQVSNDGKTADVTEEGDQAVTFGERGKIWADPQLASR
ncbi:MAG: hypothetical protein ACKO3K_11010 [Cuspidothrix sp.]